MTSEQLTAFLAVADTRSFSEAAVRLYTTQPTISRQIRALEEELQTELFLRLHKRVELTPAGRQVYDFALAQQQSETALLQSLSLYRGAAGTIRLALTPMCCTPLLHRSIARFQALHPAAIFSIQEAVITELEDLLRSNRFDLFIGRRDQIQLQCNFLDLYDDHLVLVLPKQHPLASNPVASVKRLKDEPFLLPPHTVPSYQTILGLCRQAGFCRIFGFLGTRPSAFLSWRGRGLASALWRSAPCRWSTTTSSRLWSLPSCPARASRSRLCIRPHGRCRRRRRSSGRL